MKNVAGRTGNKLARFISEEAKLIRERKSGREIEKSSVESCKANAAALDSTRRCPDNLLGAMRASFYRQKNLLINTAKELESNLNKAKELIRSEEAVLNELSSALTVNDSNELNSLQQKWSLLHSQRQELCAAGDPIAKNTTVKKAATLGSAVQDLAAVKVSSIETLQFGGQSRPPQNVAEIKDYLQKIEAEKTYLAGVEKDNLETLWRLQESGPRFDTRIAVLQQAGRGQFTPLRDPSQAELIARSTAGSVRQIGPNAVDAHDLGTIGKDLLYDLVS